MATRLPGSARRRCRLLTACDVRIWSNRRFWRAFEREFGLDRNGSGA